MNLAHNTPIYNSVVLDLGVNPALPTLTEFDWLHSPSLDEDFEYYSTLPEPNYYYDGLYDPADTNNWFSDPATHPNSY